MSDRETTSGCKYCDERDRPNFAPLSPRDFRLWHFDEKTYSYVTCSNTHERPENPTTPPGETR